MFTGRLRKIVLRRNHHNHQLQPVNNLLRRYSDCPPRDPQGGRRSCQPRIAATGGKVRDRRNRYLCGREPGVDFPVRQHDGPDALAYAFSANVYRRHLMEGQRANMAATEANMRPGDNKHSTNRANLPHLPGEDQPQSVTVAKAAEMLNVSERSVASARKVRGAGAPEPVAALDGGDMAAASAGPVWPLWESSRPPPHRPSPHARGVSPRLAPLRLPDPVTISWRIFGFSRG